jgi:hypothetical protein
MTRFSRGAKDEVPDKHSDSAQRRTVPGDVRPYSPKRIDDLYAKGKETVSRKEWHHTEHQENQFIEDHHDNGRGRYDNDCKGWVRGEGSINGGLHPQFDHGKLDPNNVPPKIPTGNKASGQDCHKSPFSAAYRRGQGEGF